MKNKVNDSGKPALAKKWITPIRLAAYAALAGSSAYIYFNSRDMEFTHYIIFVAIAAVCAMALLDCRMSVDYWEKEEKESSTVTDIDGNNQNK